MYAALSSPALMERPVAARIGPLGLPGELQLAEPARGLVVFAHGSGSSRWSSRNRWVARMLRQQALATLLFDLLTDDEAADRRQALDIELQADRLLQAIDWAAGQPALEGLGIGLFGAGTGAAAALVAAARRPGRVAAVVSRGGRLERVVQRLTQVQAPTLLIVGGADVEVLMHNRLALRHLRCNKRLEVVPGASHLFAQPGALRSVAQLAAAWFAAHLDGPARDG